EHLLVKLVAHLLDVARLLLAQKIAGPAYVEVMAGELEARPQRVERLQHLEPALRVRRQRAVGRQGEERIGPQLRASDTPAQLVELGEAEHVGAVHDERIGGW